MASSSDSHGTHDMNASPAVNQDPGSDTVARELELMKTAGIIEVAVRNPSVADYMNHWETRATTAETQLAALTKRVGELEGALTKAARHFDAIRGAVESNQVVDKDVHGTAIAARDAARRLTGGEG